MTDDEFRKLISDYLDTATPELADVELDMMEGHQSFGADHALEDHGVSQEEIRQVIYELPAPEEKRSKHGPARTLFWGATRTGRGITVVAHDDVTEGVRRLTLITAFDETEEEWRRR
jgi:hypothetical protein